jgi:hypothetical protein
VHVTATATATATSNSNSFPFLVAVTFVQGDMGSKKDNEILTLDQLQTELADDTKIKLAGIDVDGTRPSL